MPNWASTIYYVTGEKTMLTKFAMDVTLAQAITKTGGDFGHSWLGNLYIQAGYKHDGDEFIEGRDWIECRGSILSVNNHEITNGVLQGVEIYCETAWHPLWESFQRMIEEKYPGLHAQCLCEECGCEIYFNSDTDHEWFATRWQVEWNDEREEFDYDDEARFVEYVNEVAGTHYKSWAEFDMDEIEESYKATMKKEDPEVDEEELYISIHEYTDR